VNAARVLMIEDEPEIRRFVRLALESEGLDVYESVNLQRGLIDAATLALSLRYAAAVPVGIAAGWWANRRIPQRHFDAVVAGLMILTSLDLLIF